MNEFKQCDNCGTYHSGRDAICKDCIAEIEKMSENEGDSVYLVEEV